LRRVDLLAAGMRAAPEPSFDAFSERPRFNVAPSQSVAVVRLNRDGGRSLGVAKWGLVPHWAKELPKVRPINARAETVATSGMFRQAFGRRRCLVPADGFYEWRKVGGAKQPMFVHFPDDRVFALAGVWERWRERDGDDPLDTCAVVTTTPNEVMSPIHDRMPVILRPGDYAAWLDPNTSPDAAANLLRPYGDGELEAVAVDRAVNSPRNDGPECLRPWG
jgi:putative SOS response-associated peptidase YedK